MKLDGTGGGDDNPDEGKGSGERRGRGAASGPIAYMARNGVAANLLMLFILFAGLFALRGLVQEVFPEVSLDRISISVAYPGATPDEIEESIVLKIEEQIKAVDGLKQVRSTAAEGRGSVVAELGLGEDLSRALDDIKAQIDRIQTSRPAPNARKSPK